MKYYMKQLLYTGTILLLLAACKKSKDITSTDKDVTNRLTYIINDNKFNFSMFSAGLSRTVYAKTLAGPGPYTVLVPGNNAFISMGYTTEQQVLTASADWLNSLIAYHILPGTWQLNSLPFTFNQEITTITGAKMYITRWIKNTDTVLTINGTRVLSNNMPASNGLIQVLDNVLQPMLQPTLSQAIASDSSLTFLNVALQQAGMKDTFAGNKVYTIFAPSNQAFRNLGIPGIDSIRNTDPNVLKNLLVYNFFEGRKFIYDYILTTGPTNKTSQAMQNGDNISITLKKTGALFTGVTLQGSGNTSAVNITKQNVLAGNGVLHLTDQVLKENQ